MREKRQEVRWECDTEVMSREALGAKVKSLDFTLIGIEWPREAICRF